MSGLREGVLLEVGFDTVAPNAPKDISSWVYDYAAGKVENIDNRANAVPCYGQGYTFVEKLQTVSTKFRRQQADGSDPAEFMRHYYDVYELLQRPEVQKFVGTLPTWTTSKGASGRQIIRTSSKMRLSSSATQDARTIRERLWPQQRALLRGQADV